MAAEEKPKPRKTAPKPAPVAADAPKTPATTPEGERIAKVLSRAGVASRREVERMIEAGEVTVNGKQITSPALNVTAKDRITVSGHPIGAPEPPRLWLYYKPDGLVTSESDEKGRDTVFDHLPEDLPRVMTVGRLDLNSEGLLLLTNDGEIKRRLELPSTGWLRKYRVRVNGNPMDPDLEPLRRGIVVDGEKFQPMIVSLDRIQGANAWLTVGLREGKNREIRRAMSAVGLQVNRLIRTSYGPFSLGELEPGQVTEVKTRVMRDQLGLTGDQSDLPEDRAKAAPKPGGKLTLKPRPDRAGPDRAGMTRLESPREKSAARGAGYKAAAAKAPGAKGPRPTGAKSSTPRPTTPRPKKP
ncbi:rRNA pseudouridine synthase [Rhodobacter sp. KR11]|uniref:pseudouridine synthase n=1 Tax=Rhodobacter sp. KR11 TaxID=2974588 RepID=UPI002222A1C5|nr:pseudouridine synthase [Rhodobacter sp. KR11]MCW1917343.1 rRNA pseudouridine synthase [Rhodobacter sp. KR11]